MVRSRTRKAPRINPHMNTTHTLQHWFKQMYEKTGWMVLAKAKGYDYKVANYKKSIQHLLESLKYVMGEYTDPDRIHDLKVLYAETVVLRDFAAKHL